MTKAILIFGFTVLVGSFAIYGESLNGSLESASEADSKIEKDDTLKESNIDK